MKNNPLVSVIIPTYKRDVNFLIRALNSLEQQTYKNIEVVVVDDNNDESHYVEQVKKVVNDFKQKITIEYIKNDRNLGGALSRNEGIKISSGMFVAFLDDDDYYLSKKIENQLNFMLKNKLDMSFTNVIMENENGKFVDVRKYDFIKSYDNKELLKYHLVYNLTGTSSFMYRSEAIKKINGFDDVPMAQEFYLMLKTINASFKIGYLPDNFVIGTRDSGSTGMVQISQGAKKIINENKLYMFKKSFFDILNGKQRRYVKFRHFIVLSVAFKRNRKYFKSILYLLYSFLISPITFTKEILKHFKKIKEINEVITK